MKHLDKYVHIQLDVIHILYNKSVACMLTWELKPLNILYSAEDLSSFRKLLQNLWFGRERKMKNEEDDDEVLNKICLP